MMDPLPPKQRRAFSTFGGPVERAGNPDAAGAVAGMFRVDAALERALTHGFHSYAGRMHPSIARAAVAHWTKAGARVLDPFCGSGTVLVEAMAAGRGAVGRDASPLAVEIARVRSTPLGAAGRERLVEEAGRIAEESGERARKRKRPEVPFWARGEFDRFFPHVLFELLGLRDLVMETAWDDVGRALRLCLSSILVKFMREGPAAPRDGAGKRIGRGVPSRFLADRAKELALGLAALERSAPAGVPAPDIAGGDARAMPDLASASFDLVLSSPPYAGTYDYAEQHEVRFRWLQMDPTRFRSIQLGERGHGFGAVPQEWHESRRRWLSEVARLLRPGAHAVLVVGDGVVGDRAEDGARATIDSSASLGLIFVASASQTRPPRDRRLAEIFAATPRREHILVLRRMS